jgi:hypothetical protein
MGWNIADDATFYEQARRFQAQIGPTWWVMWSPSRYRFTGFHCGPASISPIEVDPGSGRDFLKELRHAELQATWPNPRSTPMRNRLLP